MVVFVFEVLQVLELCKWFCMSVVGHACSCAVWHGLEIAVAAHGGVVLVLFFVAVLSAPYWVRVLLVVDLQVHCIEVNHY